MSSETSRGEEGLHILVLYWSMIQRTKLPLPYFPQKCKLHFFQHHIHYLEISA